MSLNEKAQITVFIPVYNGENFIKCAIESVLSQTFCNFILVVADNCSTDSTIDIVKRYYYDDRVRLVVRKQNLGMIENFNRCIGDIRTKYFMALSHDDYFYSNQAIQAAYNVLESSQDVPAVYCETMFVDANNKLIMKRSFGFSGQIQSDEIAKMALIAGRNMFGVPLLVRADAVGSTRYSKDFVNTADIDFSIALGRGKKIYYLPTPLIAVRFHGSNETHRTFSSLKNEFLAMAQKHHIPLSKCDHILLALNGVLVNFKKKLFFYYLDKVRR